MIRLAMKLAVRCIVGCVAATTLPLAAEYTYYWTGNAANGDTILSLGCYKKSVDGTNVDATELPGEGDKVGLTTHSVMSISITNEDELEQFEKISRFWGIGADSRLIIDVPAGRNYDMNSMFVYDNSENVSTRGQLVKTGGGDLYLKATYFADEKKAKNYAYKARLDIQEGAVHAATNAVVGVAHYFGEVSISNGAAFYTAYGPNVGSSLIHTAVQGISGEGLITNDSPDTASSSWILRPYGTLGRQFSGLIAPSIRMFVYGKQDIISTNNTFKGGVSLFYTSNGGLGVMKVGNTGEPSSIGTSGTIHTRDSSGYLRYIGPGETSNKAFTFQGNSTTLAIIDGGANGGLILTGSWSHRSSDTKARNPVTLKGANATPCEMRGGIADAYNGLYPFDITKADAGTWIMRNNVNRKNEGAFSVTEGTLKFESIDRMYEVSALGTGTMPLDGYAHYLGGGESEAVFEYIGEAPKRAGGRPIALKGDARILTSGGRLQLSSATCVADHAVTLTLAGANTEENVLYSVSDGTAGGKVNLVKEGIGRWVLTGDQSFSGTLAVKQGRVTVRKHAFNWFKWLVKSNQNQDTTMAGATEFALYDATGTRQNLRLTYNTNDVAVNTMYLKPGEIEYDRAHPYYAYSEGHPHDRDLNKLVDAATSGEHIWNYRSLADDGTTILKWSKTDPMSWAHVVMRLTNGTPQIASYDWKCTYAVDSSSANRNLSSYELLGSTDGCNWEPLDVQSYDESPVSASHEWVFQGGTSFAEPHTSGHSIATRPAWVDTSMSNVAAVRVDEGATLDAEGEGPFPINGLEIDASCGFGTVSGFTFAASGTVTVTNVPPHQSVSLSANLSGASGLDSVNANWSVMENGRPAKRIVRLSATSVDILVAGLRVILR